MTGLRVELVHTGLLAADVLARARDLLDAAFDGELTADDWAHCLGGLHALAWRDGELIGHAALVARRLLLAGQVLRCGYVEGVAVRADVRRQGVGGALMAPLERAGRRAYDVVALSTSDAGAPFYAARGWLAWQGPTQVLTPDGLVRTPDDDDAVRVLPGSLDRAADLTCDWREGDPW